MNGSRAVWKEVLAVYSVKVNTDPDNPQAVATMDDSKKQLLTDIFWDMNEISSSTDTKTETVITETDDGHGNIVETESKMCIRDRYYGGRRKGKVTCLADECVCADEIRQAQKRKERSS